MLLVGAHSAAVALGTARQAGAPAEVWLEDATEEAGVDFLHFNGMSGKLYYLEVVGSGGALFDYDNDGDLDLYLVQGAALGASPDGRAPDLSGAVLPWRGEVPPRDRLLRNDLVATATGERRLRFVDVTDASGIRAYGYGMGAGAADFDNDGWVDLYVLNFGRNELWRNRGDGTFEEVASAAGVDDPLWSVGASFTDYDADGWLDLFVVEYLDYALLDHKTCLTERGEPDYCLPSAYEPIADRLFKNRGYGTFADVSASSGVGASRGNGLGVVAADLDGDGRQDFYVANDLMPNHLWLQQENGTFVEDGLFRGVAVSGEGKAQASMGVDVGDPDLDGDWDLFMTHFHREHNTFYRNQGTHWEDVSDASGLGPPSWSHTAFGTAFVDLDNDGWLDIVVANGAVTFPVGVDRSDDPFPLDEANQLFRNLGGSRFVEATALGGEALAESAVSRGLLVGDLDNDGDEDLVVVNNSGRAQLLLNVVGQGAAWIGVRLMEAPGRRPGARDRDSSKAATAVRDAYGASVMLEREGAPALRRRVQADGGYASSHDPRIVFGLGTHRAKRLIVQWVDGERESFPVPEAGRYTTLWRGTGTILERTPQ
jgi:hypothetical protein